MAYEYLRHGDAIDYANGGTAISAGEVVVANSKPLGIAIRPIAANEIAGICRKQGAIFHCDKASATTFAVGDDVNFVTATKLATNAVVGAGIIALGRCVEAAGNGPTKVKVDTAIGKAVNRLGLSMYFVDPSPVHHVAKHSTISHGDNSGRRNCYRCADFEKPLWDQVYQ
jgi:hypothetical protein